MSSTKENYWILSIKNIPTASEEALSQRLWDLGASGLHEDLSFEKKKDGYLPALLKKEYLHINSYFSQALSNEQMDGLRAEFPSIELSLVEEDAVDWNQQWKDQWEPFHLCEGFEIFPSWWEDRNPMNPSTKHVLEIDPGMAFGTGTHETTKLCAQLISEFSDHEIVPSGLNKILDLGTGTGILSVVLEKLGFHGIYGNDIDPECRRVFHESLEKNNCSKIQWCESWKTSGPFDLVIGNIIDGVLLELSAPISKVLKPNSYALFSGILLERKPVFIETLRKSFNFEILSEKDLGEWSALLLQVKS